MDVGAGTSDISITKDGSIIAYGMIPCAGDEITECIAKYYLTDFNEADRLKCASTLNEEVEFNDIMGLPQRVTADDIAAVTEETIKMITKGVADKIKELNGGKSVSAVFVVGGGGKAKGFTENLAEYLGLQKERVALRGSEVLGNVHFMQDDVVVDSLLVTPVGICLNYYEQRNNFIFVTVNGERIKLYNNNKLTIMDAAVQMGFPNEDLFPKRGKSLIYYVNGEKRMLRGKEGEAAIVRLNGKQTGMSTHVEKNCKVDIIPSTRGADARLEISSLREYRSNMKIIFNGKEIVCPRFVTVNGSLVSGFYEVMEGDRIEILGYYTLEQVLEFMDIICRGKIYVNNVIAPLDAKVYDNFSIACEIMKEEPNYTELMAEYGDGQFPVTNDVLYPQEEPEVQEEPDTESYNNEPEEAVRGLQDEEWDSGIIEDSILSEEDENLTEPEEIVPEIPKAAINITVNGEQVVLNGKPSYILVDVLDFYPVDTSVAHGDHLETSVNGEMCDFTCSVNEGDSVRIEWVD